VTIWETYLSDNLFNSIDFVAISIKDLLLMKLFRCLIRVLRLHSYRDRKKSEQKLVFRKKHGPGLDTVLPVVCMTKTVHELQGTCKRKPSEKCLKILVMKSFAR
jgi:hypothetical protein